MVGKKAVHLLEDLINFATVDLNLDVYKLYTKKDPMLTGISLCRNLMLQEISMK